MNVLLSRTDSIGDVVLTLPMAGFLKAHLPDVHISFLGRSYTRPVVERCASVDAFYDWEELPDEAGSVDCIIHVFPRKDISRWAQRQGIRVRIGTSHRPFHWTTCNRWVNLGRKNSDWHEAQLNLRLLRPLLHNTSVPRAALPEYYGWKPPKQPKEYYHPWLSDTKFNLILHPKSLGSAVEWPLNHYLQLVKLLSAERFHVVITGTEAEGAEVETRCPDLLRQPNVSSALGAFSLSQFIDFIAYADGLLAGSTGPLHLAAASGIHALGLYSALRPIHAGRWGPVGVQAEQLSATGEPKKQPSLASITPEQVRDRIARWIEQ